MADKANKVAENVSGPYYVDTDCTACGLCTDEAPDNFEMAASGDNAYVKKQPSGFYAVAQGEVAAANKRCFRLVFSGVVIENGNAKNPVTVVRIIKLQKVKSVNVLQRDFPTHHAHHARSMLKPASRFPVPDVFPFPV